LSLPFVLGEAEDEAEQAEAELRREAEGDPIGTPPGPAPGDLLAGHRLVTRLATGGMAEVWLADALSGTRAGQTVALKRMLPALRASPAAVERFRDEARMSALLDHPNLARTHGLFEVSGDLLLVQEVVGGETLGHLAVAARKRGERLSLPAVLHAAQGLLAALGHLHQGGRLPPTLHGDVNPDNLVATPEGSLKLIDLGLAQTIGPDGIAQGGDGALRGTAAYMAPEQVKGRPLTVRSDLFSAAVVLWELFANRPLFAARTEFETLQRVREMAAPPLRAVWKEAPTTLERLLVRGLAKEPEQRLSSAAELADALRAVAQREGLAPASQALAAEVERLAPHSVRVRT
jgi:serine/threonine-protein kinase